MTKKALLARNTHNTLVLLLLLFIALTAASMANAGPSIIVRRMLMPVWIECFGNRFPLRPKMELRDDDIRRPWVEFAARD